MVNLHPGLSLRCLTAMNHDQIGEQAKHGVYSQTLAWDDVGAQLLTTQDQKPAPETGGVSTDVDMAKDRPF